MTRAAQTHQEGHVFETPALDRALIEETIRSMCFATQRDHHQHRLHASSLRQHGGHVRAKFQSI